MCLKLGLMFDPTELNQVIMALDEDRVQRVKTSALRQKLDQYGSLGTIVHRQESLISQQPSIAPYQPSLSTIQHQNSFHIQMQPVQQTPIQPLLEKVRSFLTQIQVTDIKRLFTISFNQSKEVVELQEFLNFLQVPQIALTSQQAYQVAQNFLVQRSRYQTQEFIDISSFEQQVFAGAAQILQEQALKHNSYMTMSKIYESIRKYIMLSGGNIQKFFLESDMNKDNFISKAELKIALEKLGHFNVTDDELNQVYTLFDENKDGRISYNELCKQFSEFSNSKAIKDPNHWAFYIFESIRRASTITQQSIAQLFGLINIDKNNFNDKVTINRDQLLQQLVRMNIPLTPDFEKRLFELLDADQSYVVSFQLLADLVGLHYQPLEFQKLSQLEQQSHLNQRDYMQNKQLYRAIYDVIQSKGANLNYLKMLLKTCDPLGTGQARLEDVKIKIMDLDQSTRKIDMTQFDLELKKYQVSNGNINYVDFIGKIGYESEKIKIVNLIFMTLQSAMTKMNISQLYDFFSRFDQSNGQRRFDKNTLVQVLQSLGINLSPFELDMVLLEYDPSGLNLDFVQFENDFKEHQRSQLQNNTHFQYKDFHSYIENNKPVQQQSPMRQKTFQINEILKKIGASIDHNPNLRMTDIILRHDTTKSGILNIPNFQSILQMNFLLSSEESSHLVYHYDPQSRQQIKIIEFLQDVKDFIKDAGKRIEITGLISEMSLPQHNPIIGTQSMPQLLQRYAKDFEDITKAISVRKSDTFSYFVSYSSHSGRQHLSRQDFRSAIMALMVGHLTQQDIDAIFDNLDEGRTGMVEIIKVDQAIRNHTSLSVPQMQDEIIEKIIKAFNGDDAYVLRELSLLDKSGRGFMDIPSFVNFFVRNSPPHLKLTETDMQFLAMKYSSGLNPNQLDINIFHDDFKHTRQSKRLQAGIFSANQFGGNMNVPDSRSEFNSGHRNPLLPSHSNKNTRTEKSGLRPHPSFRLNLEPQYLEDIAKGTYLREQIVQDYFQQFASSKNSSGEGVLQENDFLKAINMLGVNWTVTSTNNVFSQIDLAFNGGSRKLFITPLDVDQAVEWGSKSKNQMTHLISLIETLDQMQDDLLKILAQFVTQRGTNLRQELQNYDRIGNKQLSLENMRDMLLNHLRIPQLNQFDVQFMSKKYVVPGLPNQIMYERLLDDLEMKTNQGSNGVSSPKSLCDTLRKGLFLQKFLTVEDYLKQMRQDLLDVRDFSGLFRQLCFNDYDENMVTQVFREMDQFNQMRVTPSQIGNFLSKYSVKMAKEFQDDIIDEIVTKCRISNLMVDNMFKQDDPMGRGVVPTTAFCILLQRQFQVKQIDAKLLSMRYQDPGPRGTDSVTYQRFIVEVNQKLKSAQLPSSSTNQTGLNMYGDQSNQLQMRLKQLLVRINDHAQKNNIQLASILSQYERGLSTGSIPQSSFLQALDQINAPIANDERFFIAENYLIQSAQSFGQSQMQAQIDYRKFLEDIKLYASQSQSQKSIHSLTKEQGDFFRNLTQHLKTHNKSAGLIETLQERDSFRKGQLSRTIMEDVFKKNGYNFNQRQFNTLFSALDTNSQGEFNLKQLYEYLFGEQEAQRLITGGSSGLNRQAASSGVQFVMPNQPMGAANAILSQIGKKLIQSNINYEEEIKKRIGYQQAHQPIPKAQESELLDVLQNCKVTLTNDERIEFQALILSKKDNLGMIPVLEFLVALGLPPQTLGLKGQRQLPKKILQQNELRLAQNIIFKLREYLNQTNKKPQDVFEKCKTQFTDVSLSLLKFKLTLASDFGPLGKQITDDQINTLVYYLAQEVPGEVSYKKLYLAFTLTEKDTPLQQEGADEIRRYETKIRDQAKQGVPFEILEFIHFMRQSGLNMAGIFKSTQRGLISRQEFDTCLKDAGFQSKDPLKLIELLDTKGNRQSVSLDKLNEYIIKTSTVNRGITPQIARDKFKNFDPKVRQYLSKISDYLKRSNITLQKIYEEMDVNRDGTVDKMEFVTKLSYLNIPGIQLSDLGMIFDALDINNDNSLSLNEFGMFIEGAKATRAQRLQDLDPKIEEDMRREIQTLFSQFDANGDGFVTADEIFKSMMALGQRITIDDAAEMIKKVDNNGDGKVDLREFTELMMPKMKEELLHQEDSMEDLRAQFLDADIDHSGTLSVDEIFNVLLKMGAEVTMEELIELMNEIDVDRNGELDIDEFVALMNMGDEIQFRSNAAKNTFINIKRARKLNPLDFFKCFKNMPLNFVPSFTSEVWTKKRKNLPSSAFMPQIDPKTMLYKDLFPLLSENVPPNAQKSQLPKLRPILTQIGCQILFDEAQGVPMPANNPSDKQSQSIIKRAVRVGLFDASRKEFINNVVQVNALYNQQDADVWRFNAWKDNGTNPLLFKTASKDEVLKPHMFLIFELIVYVKVGERVTEMSCGWCQLETHLLDRQLTHKLPIKGGSPTAEILIKDSDVHTNRTGIKYLAKVLGSKITSQLQVSIRTVQSFTPETKFHLDLLPNTCLIQKRLLYFVSGFRNYLGDKLIKQQSSSSGLRQPDGDVIISTFPKILDSPDMCEQVIQIWSEDVWSVLPSSQKMNVDLIMLKSKEFIQKLYPVIYADEFGFKESNTTMSAIGDQYLMKKREDLIKSALRYGNPQAKQKVDKPIEMLTTFKPFTIRELEFEVWDTQQAKQDRFLKQYEELGLLGANIQQPNQQQQPMNMPQIIGSKPINDAFQQNMSFGGAQNMQFSQQPRSLASALNNAFGQ